MRDPPVIAVRQLWSVCKSLFPLLLSCSTNCCVWVSSACYRSRNKHMQKLLCWTSLVSLSQTSSHLRKGECVCCVTFSCVCACGVCVFQLAALLHQYLVMCFYSMEPFKSSHCSFLYVSYSGCVFKNNPRVEPKLSQPEEQTNTWTLGTFHTCLKYLDALCGSTLLMFHLVRTNKRRRRKCREIQNT